VGDYSCFGKVPYAFDGLAEVPKMLEKHIRKRDKKNGGTRLQKDGAGRGKS